MCCRCWREADSLIGYNKHNYGLERGLSLGNKAEGRVPHLQNHTRTGLPRIIPLGDSAASVLFEAAVSPQTHRRVRAVCSRLSSAPFAGMLEFVPSFHSVAVYYDGHAVLKAYPQYIAPGEENYPYPVVAALLKDLLKHTEEQEAPAPRTVRIPVCYGGENGPDLEFVARHNGLSVQEVIDVHSSADYLVYMLGFAPGFPYLGGCPRRFLLRAGPHQGWLSPQALSGLQAIRPGCIRWRRRAAGS